MMSLLAAGLIDKIMIINMSDTLNAKAERTFGHLWNLKRFNERFAQLELEEFIKEYVVFGTYSKLSTILDTPLDHFGIIFDEAHNLVSETKTHRRDTSIKLVNVLSRAKGCKVIASTATPVINEASSFSIFEQILLRSDEPALQMPGELVSFKKAEYDHMNVIQMHNTSDPMKGKIMIDQDEYTTKILKVYQVEPQRCQLSNIVEHLISTEKETFMIEFDKYVIASDPDEININVHRLATPTPSTEEQFAFDENDDTISNLSPSTPTGATSTTASSFTANRKVIDSCIMDEIVKNIRNSKDGVILIYMSLKEDGSKLIAKLLRSYGYEPYTGNRQQDKQTFLLYESNSADKQRRLFDDAKKPENWNGSIVKIIVGSRVMRDSVDIHHVHSNAYRVARMAHSRSRSGLASWHS